MSHNFVVEFGAACNCPIKFFNSRLRAWSNFKLLWHYTTVSPEGAERTYSEDNTPRTTISFFCYFKIDELEVFQNQLYRDLFRLGVLGRIYVAHEGINADKCTFRIILNHSRPIYMA